MSISIQKRIEVLEKKLTPHLIHCKVWGVDENKVWRLISSCSVRPTKQINKDINIRLNYSFVESTINDFKNVNLSDNAISKKTTRSSTRIGNV